MTVLTGFGVLSDSQAIATAGAVIQGLYAEKSLATPPVEAALQTAADDWSGAIAALPAQGGGMAATAVKSKKREVRGGLLRKLAHDVSASCNDDLHIVRNSGFQARTTSSAHRLLLQRHRSSVWTIGHTTQLVAKVQKVPRAKAYEGRGGAVGAGTTSVRSSRAGSSRTQGRSP